MEFQCPAPEVIKANYTRDVATGPEQWEYPYRDAPRSWTGLILSLVGCAAVFVAGLIATLRG